MESIADMGILCVKKKTRAVPKDWVSTCPDMRRTSRYFAVEFRFIFRFCEMSVIVKPFGCALRRILIREMLSFSSMGNLWYHIPLGVKGIVG
jgi:hypothetical protein